MRNIFLLILLLGISMYLRAAIGEPEVEWKQTYSFSEIGFDLCYKAIEVEDGYVLAGCGGRLQTDTGVDIDFSLSKINTDGELVWQYFYDHTNDEYEPQVAYDVIQSQDGGFILAGYTNRNSTGAEFFIVKTDKNGLKLWEKLIKTQTRPGKILGIESTSDGGFIIAGTKTDPNILTEDLQAFKFNINGELEWGKTYDYGGWKEFGHSVQQTADGGYIFVGDVIHSGSGALLIKTDSKGEVIWKHVYNQMHGGGSYHNVREIPGGGFIIAGYADPFEVPGVDDGTRAWIIKVDAEGNEEWNKDYPIPGIESAFYDIKVLDDGGYVIAGCKGIDISNLGSGWIIRTDSEGNIFWEKEFTGKYLYNLYSVELTHDNGFLLAGCDGTGFLDLLSEVKVSKLSPETNVPAEFEVKNFFGEVKIPTIGNYQVNLSAFSIYESVANVDHYEILRDGELIYTEPAINPDGIFHSFKFIDYYVTVNGLYDYDLIVYNTSGKIIKEKSLALEISEDQTFRTELSANVVNGLVTLTWKSNYEANCVTGGFNFWEVRRMKNPGTTETILGQLDAVNPYGIHTYQFEDTPGTGEYDYVLFVTPDGLIYSLVKDVLAVVSTSNDIENITQKKPQLGNNYPNSFNSATRIEYLLSVPDMVTLTILNASGQKIETLVNEWQKQGTYQIIWDGSNFSSGIYFYQLQTNHFIQTKKMILSK
jgi:hypothetical protein